MKKVLSIVLAIAMIATMSAVAFAETFGGETGVGSIPNGGFKKEGIVVSGSYENAGFIPMYKVDVEWPSFAYNFKIGKTWDPVNYVWVMTGNGQWTDATARNINITNHSSDAIKVAASYSGAEGTDFDFVPSTTDGVIAGASKGDNEIGAPVSGTIAATFEPAATYKIADDVENIGTITITITAAA